MRPGMDKMEKCNRKIEMVELVYDEADGVYLAELRSHLSSCAECSNEFSSLFATRTNIVEFRKDVFECLETPVIAFPPADISENISKSIWVWLDGLRYAFVVKLSFAGILLAVLAGLYGLIYLERLDEVQVASNTAAPLSIDSAQVEKDPFPPLSDPLTVSKDAVNIAEREPEIPRRNRGVGTAKSKKAAAAVKSADRRNENQLTDDFADDSLRLADLLEQIGG